MLPFINIFGKTIGSYGVVAVLGAFACAFFGLRQAKKQSIVIEDIILVMLAIFGGLLVGGHILYGITHTPQFVSLIKNLFDYSFAEIVQKLGEIFGGMVFYGGLFGAISAAAVYCRFSKVFKRDVLFDILAFTIPLFHTFGRIGCFLGGCCYGIESKFGFLITGNTLNPEINGVVRFPVQLVEAVCNLILFIIIYRLAAKQKLRGKLIFIYLGSYATIRFLLEFLRGDEIRGKILGISTSQWISIGILLFIAIYIIIKKRKKIA